jgi:hypothetical protein
VTVSAPATGTWVAVIDGFGVPSGSTTYAYTDSLANPAYGGVTVLENAATPRGPGDIWPFSATGTALSAAGTGRFLRATVSVREAVTGTTLGSATVIFANVTP